MVAFHVPAGAFTVTVSPGDAPSRAEPSGESGATAPLPPPFETTTRSSSPSASVTSTVDPTATTPAALDGFLMMTAFRSFSSSTAIWRSSRPCSFLAAWYSKFSDRSPNPRAVAIASTASARFGPFSSASSASSASCSFWVSSIIGGEG